MSGLISTLIIFVTLMVIGYVCVRSGMLSENFAKDASQLTLNILICATIINSVILNPPELSSRETMHVMALTFMVYGLFYVVARLLAPIVAPTKKHVAVVMLLMAVNNNMFIGVPVADQVLGSDAVFYITLGCIPFNLILYTYGIICLNKDDRGKSSVRLKDMLLCPPLIATTLSVIVFMTRVQVPPLFVKLISTLANATMPMSMFVIGAALSSVSLTESFKNPRLYIVSFVRLIVQPLITWCVFRFIISDPALLGAFVITAACPTGIVVTALSIQFGKDAVFPSECILLDTALSMLTIPVLINILL